MNFIQNPSPNYGSRDGHAITHIVVHCTDGNFPYDMQYLCDPNPNSTVGPVSSHFVVSPLGLVYQLVDTKNTAWHAGRVNNPSVKLPAGNPNTYSIGIEVSMVSTNTMGSDQKQALKDLLKLLCDKYSIPVDRQHIIGHREIYSLKTCPGTINLDEIVGRLVTVPVASPTVPDYSNLTLPQKQTLLASLMQRLVDLLKSLKK